MSRARQLAKWLWFVPWAVLASVPVLLLAVAVGILWTAHIIRGNDPDGYDLDHDIDVPSWLMSLGLAFVLAAAALCPFRMLNWILDRHQSYYGIEGTA